jgi:hypothetical protein
MVIFTDDHILLQGSTLADRLKVPFIDRKLIEIKKPSTNGSSTTSLPDVCSSITTITNDDDIIRYLYSIVYMLMDDFQQRSTRSFIRMRINICN